MPEVREALLDAAYDTAVTTGWQRARMADVAAAAGVSRQTLYDQFGGRDGLAQSLALRETVRFLDGVERAIAGHTGDVAQALEAATAFALQAARGNPLLRAILTDDGGLLPYITTRAEPVLAAAKDHLVAHFAEHWPEVPATVADEVGEVAVRLTLSYIVLPGTAPADAARRVAAAAARVVERSRG